MLAAPVKTLALVFLVVAVWGGNFISIAYILKGFELFPALFLRLFCVFILLSPFLKLPTKKNALALFFASVAIVPGHFGFLFLSILHTDNVGSISVFIQLAIPFSVLFAWVFLKERLGKGRSLGLGLSFGGIVCLFYEPAIWANKEALFLAIISALGMGAYFVLIKKVKGMNAINIIAWTSFMGLPFIHLMGLWQGESFTSVWFVRDINAWLAFFYTTLLGSIVSHSVWARLVATQEISFISPFLLLVPLVAVLLGAIIFNEPLEPFFMGVSGVIVFGVFLVFKYTPKTIIKEKHERAHQTKFFKKTT